MKKISNGVFLKSFLELNKIPQWKLAKYYGYSETVFSKQVARNNIQISWNEVERFVIMTLENENRKEEYISPFGMWSLLNDELSDFAEDKDKYNKEANDEEEVI